MGSLVTTRMIGASSAGDRLEPPRGRVEALDALGLPLVDIDGSVAGDGDAVDERRGNDPRRLTVRGRARHPAAGPVSNHVRRVDAAVRSGGERDRDPDVAAERGDPTRHEVDAPDSPVLGG